jgi:dephospho-CoA kinase
MSLIAICGFQGSGKDTLANILIEKYGYTKVSFGGILKDIVSIIFNWDRDLLEGITIKSREWRETVDDWWATRLDIPNLTPRYILQHIGTDILRNKFHPDIWVAALERKLYNKSGIVITDCRFTNEIAMVKKLDGKLIHIYKGIIPSWFGKEDEFPKDIHCSEVIWTKSIFDKTIENNGSINDLNIKISKYLAGN